MPFAVELFFDPELDRAVRQIWSVASKQARVSDRMAETGNRPHVSLAAFNLKAD
jgi:hypothetical protein